MQFAVLIASGLPFFIGAAMLGLAAIDPLARCGWWRVGVRIVMALGALLVGISAAPVPTHLYAAGTIALTAWFVASFVVGPKSSRRATNTALAARVSLELITLSAIVMEARWQFTPVLPPQNMERLYVVGDSLSAGIDDRIAPWPARVEVSHGVMVENLAVAGATTATALGQVERLTNEPGVVVVLIGGNDLIAGRPAPDFGRDLDDVLRQARMSGRTVVMFELPLLPLCNAYGGVQRKLARRHRVPLIPKHRLAMILAKSDSTCDGLHLSEAGHEALADLVWEVVGQGCAAN